MAATTRTVAGRRRHGPTGVVVDWQLDLLDSWSLRRDGREIALRRREQRLLALLALQGTRPRHYVAGMLWPESTDARAAGSLRAAAWQVDQGAPGLLAHDRSHIGLAPRIRVDVHELLDRAKALHESDPRDADDFAYASALRALLRGELLPGWYDDWLIFERTRVQHVQQHALEALADLLADRGDVVAALQAGFAAVSIEPLRESAHRSLIRAQIRAGNYSDAVRQYSEFRARIKTELGVAPSELLESLIRPLLVERLVRTSTAT